MVGRARRARRRMTKNHTPKGAAPASGSTSAAGASDTTGTLVHSRVVSTVRWVPLRCHCRLVLAVVTEKVFGWLPGLNVVGCPRFLLPWLAPWLLPCWLW